MLISVLFLQKERLKVIVFLKKTLYNIYITFTIKTTLKPPLNLILSGWQNSS